MGVEKNILDYIMLIIVAFSLFVSFKSYQISDDAKKIAEQALNTTNKQFIQTNRPYILIEPKKFDDGMYWDIGLKKNIITIKLKFELKNVGNVTAKDLSIPDVAVHQNVVVHQKKIISKDVYNVESNNAGKISLGPGDIVFINPESMMTFENEGEAKTYYLKATSEKAMGLVFQLPVEYTNELDQTQRYRSLVMAKIYNEEATILKSDLLNISDEN
jgi:hypothetical protein